MTNQELRFVEDQSFRRQILEEIKATENRLRMQSSLQDCEIYDGKIRPYVLRALSNKGYSQQNIAEMPVVASVNVTRKVVDARASLYKQSPTRQLSGATKETQDLVEAIYDEAMVDTRFLATNRMFELQNKQTHMMVVPKMGKLKMRTLKAHQVNVIPSEEDAEVGEIYIISSFDKYDSNLREHFSNDLNEKIGDKDDYKSAEEKYIIWSNSLHFVMDGYGNIVTEEYENPIAPLNPVVEISSEAKDFEYWRQAIGGDNFNGSFAGGELSNFAVEYNLDLTMLSQTVEMNSFAQAIISGPKESLPNGQSMILGPTRILHLPTDPNLPNGDVNFRFESPSADISSAQNFVLSKLAQFLSSHGVSAKTIAGDADAGENFASGVSKMLSAIERFESSRESQAIFMQAEQRAFEVIKAWINIAGGTDLLPYYNFKIPEDATMSIIYEKPEAVLTESEKLDIIERKIDLQLMTKVEALMELRNMSREEAEERAQEIEEEWMPKSGAISTTSSSQLPELTDMTSQQESR